MKLRIEVQGDSQEEFDKNLNDIVNQINKMYDKIQPYKLYNKPEVGNFKLIPDIK